MERNDFYKALSNVKNSYEWQIDNDNNIVATKSRGKNRGSLFNPVTAVASLNGYTVDGNNKRATLKAGTALGLPRSFTEHLYEATVSRSNRGHAQVVRGKIRSALEI